MQPRIIQISSDDTHRKIEVTKSVYRDFPVAEVTSEKQHWPAGRDGLNAFFALIESKHVGAVIQTKTTFQLNDLTHHAKQMPPHPINDAINLGVRKLFAKGLTNILCGNTVSSHFLWHNAVHEPCRSIRTPLDGAHWKAPQRKKNGAKECVFTEVSDFAGVHAWSFQNSLLSLAR
jgi:hypothetical protein